MEDSCYHACKAAGAKDGRGPPVCSFETAMVLVGIVLKVVPNALAPKPPFLPTSLWERQSHLRRGFPP